MPDWNGWNWNGIVITEAPIQNYGHRSVHVVGPDWGDLRAFEVSGYNPETGISTVRHVNHLGDHTAMYYIPVEGRSQELAEYADWIQHELMAKYAGDGSSGGLTYSLPFNLHTIQGGKADRNLRGVNCYTFAEECMLEAVRRFR